MVMAIANLVRMKPSAVAALAATVAWSPCKHHRQCVGICAYCWMLYLSREEEDER